MTGDVPGVEAGAWFEDRRALAAAGVHRPLQAGICGTAAGGAESVVLSGGYPDDWDGGDVIVYTGAGGQNADGRHVYDQTLTRGNAALATSLRLGLPVRVVRGSGHGGPHAPEAGYRYDGLYRVADYWAEPSRATPSQAVPYPAAPGRDGPLVWRFRLERLAGEAPGRVHEEPTLFGVAHPERRLGLVSRVVRETAVTRSVKERHGFRCQVCGQAVETPAGPYAEAAHIRPLGRPHDGPDVPENVLCLCPNHHVAFDRWAFAVADSGALVGLPGRLRTARGHTPARVHLAYHRALYHAAAAAAPRRTA